MSKIAILARSSSENPRPGIPMKAQCLCWAKYISCSAFRSTTRASGVGIGSVLSWTRVAQLPILLQERCQFSGRSVPQDWPRPQNLLGVRSSSPNALSLESQGIEEKRERILSAYFDGLILPEDCDRRIAEVDSSEMPPSSSEMAQGFAPFYEWRFKIKKLLTNCHLLVKCQVGAETCAERSEERRVGKECRL